MDGENYAMRSFDEGYASSNSTFTVKSKRLGYVELQKEEKLMNSFDIKPEGRRLLRIQGYRKRWAGFETAIT